MRPIGTALLIQPFRDNIMYGHLHLPDTAHTRSNHGIVIKRGPRVRSLIPGEWVLYNRKFAQDVGDAGDHVIVDERHCIATMAEPQEVDISVTVTTDPRWASHARMLIDELEQAHIRCRHGLLSEGRMKYTEQSLQHLHHTEALVVLSGHLTCSFIVGYAWANKIPVFIDSMGMKFADKGFHMWAGTNELVVKLKEVLRGKND